MVDYVELAPLVGLAVIASAVYPFTHLEMNFETSNTELYVQVNYDYSEELSLEISRLREEVAAMRARCAGTTCAMRRKPTAAVLRTVRGRPTSATAWTTIATRRRTRTTT